MKITNSAAFTFNFVGVLWISGFFNAIPYFFRVSKAFPCDFLIKPLVFLGEIARTMAKVCISGEKSGNYGTFG